MNCYTRISIVCVVALAAIASPIAADEEVDELMERARALQQRLDALENEVERFKRATEHGKPSAPVERPTHAETTPPREEDFRAYWQEGLRFDTRDERFKIRVRGRFHQDWAWFDQAESLEYV